MKRFASLTMCHISELGNVEFDAVFASSSCFCGSLSFILFQELIRREAALSECSFVGCAFWIFMQTRP